tara:strand:+ start:556 stop:1284 length:729 start_codon:yes stop_codon:yes gene_type:complete
VKHTKLLHKIDGTVVEVPRNYKRRTSSTVNFGYEISEIEGYLKPIPKELEYLQDAVIKIKKGESTRAVAAWLSEVTNRTISNMGLWKYIKRNTSIVFDRWPRMYKKRNKKRSNKSKLTQLNLKLTKLNAPDKGFIYLVSSPSFDGWVKIGQSADLETRYRSYNHSNPRRDFKLDCYIEVENKWRAEYLLIEIVKKFSIKSSGREWFKVKNKNKVINIINNYTDRKITMEDLITIKAGFYKND